MATIDRTRFAVYALLCNGETRNVQILELGTFLITRDRLFSGYYHISRVYRDGFPEGFGLAAVEEIPAEKGAFEGESPLGASFLKLLMKYETSVYCKAAKHLRGLRTMRSSTVHRRHQRWNDGHHLAACFRFPRIWAFSFSYSYTHRPFREMGVYRGPRSNGIHRR